MASSWAGNAILDMVGDYVTGLTVKALLCDSTFVFDKHIHDFRDDVAGEIAGAGYTAGGITLTGVAAELDAANSRVELVGDDAGFGVITAADIARLVVYIDTGNAATDRILGVHEFPSEARAGEDFTFAFNDDDADPGTAGVIGVIGY